MVLVKGDRVDVAVVGAGFGGLGAALRLAELGRRVAVFETLAYPGGCASTFRRAGAAYEAGATLFAGLADDGFLRTALRRHGVEVDVDLLDPVLHVRAPGLELDVPADRARFVDAVVRIEDAVHEVAIRRFFEEQERLSAILWSLFEDPARLFPFGLRQLARHAARAPRYLPLLRWVGKSLGDMLDAFGLEQARRLRTYLDALCQITVQVDVAGAEALFALAAIDYPFRDTGHVVGGIGALADAVVEATRRAGGDVRFTDRVNAITPHLGGFRIRSRRGETWARQVVLNLLPSAAARLLDVPLHPDHTMGRLDTAVRSGWGAAMLYRVVRDEGLLTSAPHHVDITDGAGARPVEGHHVFVSVSGASEARAGAGFRTVTASTHVPVALDGEAIARVQQRMRETLRGGYPELDRATVREMTASPRTFARFVGRPDGLVGGVPRRVGLASYGGLLPRAVSPGVWLVGDSVFPGQSVLASALGGWKTAEALHAD